MSKDIPDWAKVRAWDVMFPRSTAMRECTKVREMSVDDHRLNVARYIAEHEDPPVDPLLIEAREIAARQHSEGAYATAFRRGDEDNSFTIKTIYAALKRGIEIGESQ